MILTYILKIFTGLIKMIKNMDFTIENYGISSFLFCKLPEQNNMGDIDANIAISNTINSVLPCMILQKGDDVYLRYDLVCDYKLSGVFVGTVTKERLHWCLYNILNTLILAENSGLDISNFIFNNELIYMHKVTNRVYMIYMPVNIYGLKHITLKQFLKNLIYSIQYDINDDLSYFVKLHNYFSKVDEINIKEFRDTITSFAGYKNVNQSNIKGMSSSFYSASDRTNETNESFNYYGQQSAGYGNSSVGGNENYNSYNNVIKTGGTSSGYNFIATNDPNNNYNNQVYNKHISQSTNYTIPHLIVKANGKRIDINANVFKLGRDTQQNNYVVNNLAVGRIHALIITNNSGVYLQDNRSTNGTFVNDQRLNKGASVQLFNNDIISLANEEFIFIIS